MKSQTPNKSSFNKKPLKNQSIISPAQHNFPILTVLIGLSALSATLSSQLTSLLQFDRTAFMDGEVWRVFTGHLTHWSLSHLFWDILVFLVLAGVIERFSRRRLLVCFASASLIISLLVFTFLPEMTFYRGLSGIDSALFMMLLVMFYRQRPSRHSLFAKCPIICSAYSSLARQSLNCQLLMPFLYSLLIFSCRFPWHTWEGHLLDGSLELYIAWNAELILD